MKYNRLALCGLLLVALSAMAACDVVTPLHKKKPLVSTPVPADFAIVIDENYDTYYARTHIEQVVLAKNALSRTTYTLRRDYNNTVSNQYAQEHPLNPAQLQAMWDEVQRQELLKGAWTWTYFSTPSDWYKHDYKIIQIRANGMIKSYKQVNHWDGAIRDLALQVQAVRLPIMGGAGTQPVTAPEEPAATEPATTTPATMPAVVPTVPTPTDAIGDPTGVPATKP